MSMAILNKLKLLVPVVIVGASIAASAALWIPAGDTENISKTPVLKELDERLSSGSARLSELIEVTNARPVFHASRRPIATPEAPKAPEPVLSLLGVIAEDNAETLAFVKLSSNGALYRIGKGETVGRWRITDIGTDQISVSKDGNAPYVLRIGD